MSIELLVLGWLGIGVITAAVGVVNYHTSLRQLFDPLSTKQFIAGGLIATLLGPIPLVFHIVRKIVS